MRVVEVRLNFARPEGVGKGPILKKNVKCCFLGHLLLLNHWLSQIYHYRDHANVHLNVLKQVMIKVWRKCAKNTPK